MIYFQFHSPIIHNLLNIYHFRQTVSRITLFKEGHRTSEHLVRRDISYFEVFFLQELDDEDARLGNLTSVVDDVQETPHAARLKRMVWLCCPLVVNLRTCCKKCPSGPNPFSCSVSQSHQSSGRRLQIESKKEVDTCDSKT